MPGTCNSNHIQGKFNVSFYSGVLCSGHKAHAALHPLTSHALRQSTSCSKPGAPRLPNATLSSAMDAGGVQWLPLLLLLLLMLLFWRHDTMPLTIESKHFPLLPLLLMMMMLLLLMLIVAIGLHAALYPHGSDQQVIDQLPCTR